MPALTVRVGHGEIELWCPECGTVAVWPSGVELAILGAVEQDHATQHALAALRGAA